MASEWYYPSIAIHALLPLLLSILASFLIVAWREAMLLLIDIADTLLHHHSRTETSESRDAN